MSPPFSWSGEVEDAKFDGFALQIGETRAELLCLSCETKEIVKSWLLRLLSAAFSFSNEYVETSKSRASHEEVVAAVPRGWSCGGFRCPFVLG